MNSDVPTPLSIGSQGLSDALAAERLRSEGPNELPTARPKSQLRIAAEVLREPMFLLLIATGAVYLALGSIEEAIALAASIFVVIGITLYQETKTERTLQALRDLSSPRALVIRDGQKKRIAGRDVVRGDVLVLSEGDRVSADALDPQPCITRQIGLRNPNESITGVELTAISPEPLRERVRSVHVFARVLPEQKLTARGRVDTCVHAWLGFVFALDAPLTPSLEAYWFTELGVRTAQGNGVVAPFNSNAPQRFSRPIGRRRE